MTDIDQLRARGHGLAQALLKSAAVDPEQRIGCCLIAGLADRMEHGLAPDAHELRDLFTTTVGAMGALAAYAANIVEEAKANGVGLENDPAKFDTPYDLWFALEEMAEAWPVDQGQIDAGRGVLED